MPAPATIEEFLDLIRKSGVVDEARIATYVQKLKALSSSGFPTETTKLAGLMVRDGLLTYFQAEQFLQGKWKRFTIGKYKVLERIGSGGMGQVYLCEHKLMRRRVALKVLPTAKAEDQSSLERFYREARAVAALDHQNIVRAYDIDQDDNLHYLVMEYVDGASLQEIIKKTGPMNPLRASHYVYWSAVGMQHAHEQGIIHRDIKPGNILVDRQGVVKILDMGLARFFNDDEDLITKRFDENVLGTADYLAPEQALDSHSVDGRADIYSLGATFYFLLTGGPPFLDGTVAQKLIWHQNRDPKPIKSVRQDVPEGLVNILNKMMAKDPAKRFQTPAELAATLGPWIQTPIPPPPDEEMPQLCAAVLAAGGGSPTTISRAMPAPANNTGTNFRRPATSSVQVAPIPTPPMGPGSSRQKYIAPPRDQSPIDSPLVEAMVETPEVGEPLWAAISDTGANSASPTNNDRRQSRPATPVPARIRPTKSAKTGKKSKLWLWLCIGAIVLGGGIAVILSMGSGNPTNPTPKGPDPSQTEGGRKIYVSKQPGTDPKEVRVVSVQLAIERARAKDRIILLDDEVNDVVLVTKAPKDLTIESAEGKRVVWKATDEKDNRLGILEIGNAENFRLRGITFNANNLKASALRIVGRCPGLIIEDVELMDAKESNLKIVDCQGDSGNRVLIKGVRITASKKSADIGVAIFAGAGKKDQPRPTCFVRIEDCVFDGPFRIAAIQVEGEMTDTEMVQNRILNAGCGLFVKKTNPEQTLRFLVANNTFHTLGGPALRFENSEVLSTPPNAAKHRFEWKQNFFFDVAGPLVRSDDNKPLPALIQENNARNVKTPDGQPALNTFVVDPLVLPVDPKDKSFLKSDALKAVGPSKVTVGASGP